MPTELPRHVAAFVARHLRSFDDLRLLMAFIKEPDRWWDADAVAHELTVSRNEAQRTLEHFAARNLLEVRLTTDVRYRFRPGSDNLRTSADECIGAYRADPVTMVRAFFPNLQNLRDFADAFRIRRQ